MLDAENSTNSCDLTRSQKYLQNSSRLGSFILTIKYSEFENEIPCEAIVKFQMRGRVAAAYLLRRGNKKDESFQFVFGFETKGVHSTLRESQVDPIFDGIESGLKDLLPGEKFQSLHRSLYLVYLPHGMTKPGELLRDKEKRSNTPLFTSLMVSC